MAGWMAELKEHLYLSRKHRSHFYHHTGGPTTGWDVLLKDPVSLKMKIAYMVLKWSTINELRLSS